MTHADTTAAFLNTIIANPADDGCRLTFADWLEEHGQGERAELIRVQCELAKTKKEPCCDINGNTIEGDEHRMKIIPCPFCEWSALRRRANDLLAEHEAEWVRDELGLALGIKIYQSETNNFYHSDDLKFTWHRGFIHQVECQLETWRGRTCERCHATGAEPFIGGNWTPQNQKCRHCHGVGRVGGIGALLVRRAPIEAVVVTDYSSYGNNETGIWFDFQRWSRRGQHAQSNLPRDLFLLLKKEKFGSYICYPSAADANSALSTELLAEARAALEPSGPRVVQCGA